jgi:predicted GIY-YIG superfamily endonuclease
VTADPTPAPSPSPTAGRHPLGTVYLFHFDQRYEHAGHYTGWAEDLDHRVAEHLAGHGARLIEVITQAGISFRLARTWPGVTRARERQLKRQGGASRHCPICQDDRKPAVFHAAPVVTVITARVISSRTAARVISSGPRRSRPAAPDPTGSERSSN